MFYCMGYHPEEGCPEQGSCGITDKTGYKGFLTLSGKTSNNAAPPTAPALPKKLKMIIKLKMVIAPLLGG